MQILFCFAVFFLITSFDVILLSKAQKKTLAPEKWQDDFDRFHYKINVF